METPFFISFLLTLININVNICLRRIFVIIQLQLKEGITMKKLIALVLVVISTVALATPALACGDGCNPPPPPPPQTCCYCHQAPCQCHQACKPEAPKTSKISLVKGASINMRPCCDAMLYRVVHCKTDGLNVRKGPSTKDPIKVRVQDGGYLWVIKFVGKCKNWAYVQYANDRYGYVMTSYIKPVEGYDCDW